MTLNNENNQPENTQTAAVKAGGFSHVPFIDPIYQVRYLWEHKWGIIAIVLVSALLGFLAAAAVESTYRSTALLKLKPQGENVAPIKDVYEHRGESSEYILTELEVLRSRELAGRVVDKLNLTQSEHFSVEEKTKKAESATVPRWKLWLDKFSEPIRRLLPLEKTESQSEIHPRQYAIGKLQKALKIEQVLFSYIVKVHAETPDPSLSADIANSLVEAYVEYISGVRVDSTQQASDWLTIRLAELKSELDESERKLQEFYEREELINVGGARELLAKEYSDDVERLRDAQRREAELSGIYAKIEKAGSDVDALQGINYIQDQNMVQLAKRQYLEAREDVSELASRYGKKHPQMIAAQAKMQEAKEAYEKQIKLAADAVVAEYEFAQNTARSVRKTAAESRAEVQNLDRKQHTLEALQHEVATNRQLFDSFLQRYKETDIAGNLENMTTRVVDRAVPNDKPYWPNKTIWTMSAAIIGLILALMLTLVRGFLDDTVNSVATLQDLMQVPVLAVLPQVKEFIGNTKKMARIELDDPSSAYSEAIRTLRTSIMLADSAEARKKIILIASSVPSEGKTCVAANLSVAFGQVEKTLLVDCDLRRPSSAKYLQMPNGSAGLVEVLSGEAKAKDAIKRFDAGNIDLLTCTTPPPNPSELLGSERFKVLLERLAEYYDRIILDSPPCQVVSDVFLLADKADTIIFLAKAESTRRRAIADAMERFKQSNGKMLGAVLNQVEIKKTAQYGMYYYPEYYGQASKT